MYATIDKNFNGKNMKITEEYEQGEKSKAEYRKMAQKIIKQYKRYADKKLKKHTGYTLTTMRYKKW